jgi:hypothetical protein
VAPMCRRRHRAAVSAQLEYPPLMFRARKRRRLLR